MERWRLKVDSVGEWTTMSGKLFQVLITRLEKSISYSNVYNVYGVDSTYPVAVCGRDGTGLHFVTQRPSDPGIQRPGDPVDPVTLLYNELQMSTYVWEVFSGQRIFNNHKQK